MERETGLEPTTSSLGRRQQIKKRTLRFLAPRSGDTDYPVFTLRFRVTLNGAHSSTSCRIRDCHPRQLETDARRTFARQISPLTVRFPNQNATFVNQEFSVHVGTFSGDFMHCSFEWLRLFRAIVHMPDDLHGNSNMIRQAHPTSNITSTRPPASPGRIPGFSTAHCDTPKGRR